MIRNCSQAYKQLRSFLCLFEICAETVYSQSQVAAILFAVLNDFLRAPTHTHLFKTLPHSQFLVSVTSILNAFKTIDTEQCDSMQPIANIMFSSSASKCLLHASVNSKYFWWQMICNIRGELAPVISCWMAPCFSVVEHNVAALLMHEDKCHWQESSDILL